MPDNDRYRAVLYSLLEELPEGWARGRPQPASLLGDARAEEIGLAPTWGQDHTHPGTVVRFLVVSASTAFHRPVSDVGDGVRVEKATVTVWRLSDLTAEAHQQWRTEMEARRNASFPSMAFPERAADPEGWFAVDLAQELEAGLRGHIARREGPPSLRAWEIELHGAADLRCVAWRTSAHLPTGSKLGPVRRREAQSCVDVSSLIGEPPHTYLCARVESEELGETAGSLSNKDMICLVECLTAITVARLPGSVL